MFYKNVFIAKKKKENGIINPPFGPPSELDVKKKQMSPSDRATQLYPRHRVSFSSPSMTRRPMASTRDIPLILYKNFQFID
jgi:hypothetical protein